MDLKRKREGNYLENFPKRYGGYAEDEPFSINIYGNVACQRILEIINGSELKYDEKMIQVEDMTKVYKRDKLIIVIIGNSYAFQLYYPNYIINLTYENDKLISIKSKTYNKDFYFEEYEIKGYSDIPEDADKIISFEYNFNSQGNFQYVLYDTYRNETYFDGQITYSYPLYIMFRHINLKEKNIEYFIEKISIKYPNIVKEINIPEILPFLVNIKQKIEDEDDKMLNYEYF